MFNNALKRNPAAVVTQTSSFSPVQPQAANVSFLQKTVQTTFHYFLDGKLQLHAENTQTYIAYIRS